MSIHPIIQMDFPDPDVIRVEDTYYMVSTTMHFMPGCVILRSYDLRNWEIVEHVYDSLDETEGQRLQDCSGIYGKGMWAASIRYHKNRFYLCFVANDTGKTYLYQSENISGPWEKQEIQGFYHDPSLLFDEDGRIYIVYGNTEIHLTELDEQLKGPKENGIDRIIIKEQGVYKLGYEGAHIYKIHGKYYVFLIHSPGETWFRREACFVSDSIEGEFTGRDVLADDLNYCHQGVAQGGIVDTPDGDWYSILFQDRGAVGRSPVLVPVKWEQDFPVFGEGGKVPEVIETRSTRPNHRYEPLFESDDFQYVPDKNGKIPWKKVWEFKHQPDSRYYSVSEGEFRIYSGKVCANLEAAVNTLTQRTRYPRCEAEVSVNGNGMKVGDYAGLSAFLGNFGFVALKKEEDGMYLVMAGKEAEYEKIKLDTECVRLKVKLEFEMMKDEAEFFYETSGEWKKIGITKKLYFQLDHFCGCRFALFFYSTKTIGGSAGFSEFIYR